MAIELIPTNLVKEDKNNQQEIQIKAFDFDGVLIPPQPIPQLIQINFPALGANKVGKFCLSDQISFDLLVRSYQIDVESDDFAELQPATYHIPPMPLVIYLVEPGTNKVVGKNAVHVSGYPVEPVYMVFKHDLNIHIKSAHAFNLISFYCEPIYISNSIDATDLSSKNTE